MRNIIRVITLSLVLSFLVIGISRAQEIIPDNKAKVVEICHEPMFWLLNNLQPSVQGHRFYPTLDQGISIIILPYKTSYKKFSELETVT